MGRKSEGELPLAAMHRLIKKAGALRVSDEAAEELRKTLEELAVKIAREAMDYCSHAKRKTVLKEDIKLALKKFIEAV